MKITVFVVLAVLLLALFFYFEMRRSNELQNIANNMGYRFLGGLQKLPDELDKVGFYLFSQGDKEIKNLLDGDSGDYRVRLFGYFYQAVQGDRGQRGIPGSVDEGVYEQRGQTVAWLSSSEMTLPDFDLMPVDNPRRLAAKQAGFQQITFDGKESFNSRYILAGRDEEALRQFFNNAVLDYLVSLEADYILEGRGNQWLLYQDQLRIPPKQISGFAGQAVELIDMLSTTRDQL